MSDDARNPPRSTGPAGYAANRAVLLCDCGHETEVFDSRGNESGDVIRRHRKCKGCRQVFTTYESRRNPAGADRASAALDRFEKCVDAVNRALRELKAR